MFNVAAPPGRDAFSGLLNACAETTGAPVEFEWVYEAWLIEHGVTQWTELPLWRALPTAWSMRTDRAQAAGLTCRPLAETVADTWVWMTDGGQPVEHERWQEHGIDPEKERQLLAEWRR